MSLPQLPFEVVAERPHIPDIVQSKTVVIATAHCKHAGVAYDFAGLRPAVRGCELVLVVPAPDKESSSVGEHSGVAAAYLG